MSANLTVVKMVVNAWKVLAADLPEVGTEGEYSSRVMAAHTKTNDHAAGRCLRFLRGLGLIDYRSEYGKHFTGGQRVYMVRKLDLEAGLTAIYKHFDAGRSYSWFETGQPGGPAKGTTKVGTTRPKEITETLAKIAVSDAPTEETRAIAGPEPEAPMKEALRPALRLDDVEALVEAARQYTNRGEAVQTKIAELRELGVTVDADMLTKAVHFEVDERLEAVAVVLPLIDNLQFTNQRLRRDAADDKRSAIEARRELGTVTKERDELKRANTRLAERNVALREAKTETAAAPV